jgi:hypothetical protein
MTLYETIFARRSVRKYDGMPLDTAALNGIKSYVDSSKQLPGQSAKFEIVDDGKLKGGFAPHAILAYAGEDDAQFVNIGYTLQGVDLWLQANGYGSIWCGMASPKEPTADYRILLGFGKTDVSLRGGEDDYKRKKISEMSDTDNVVSRAVRVAPSAVNFQPWKLSFTDGTVKIAANVRGMGRVIPGRLYLFDLGIALKHAEISLEHEGRRITAFELDGKAKDFTVTIKL